MPANGKTKTLVCTGSLSVSNEVAFHDNGAGWANYYSKKFGSTFAQINVGIQLYVGMGSSNDLTAGVAQCSFGGGLQAGGGYSAVFTNALTASSSASYEISIDVEEIVTPNANSLSASGYPAHPNVQWLGTTEAYGALTLIGNYQPRLGGSWSCTVTAGGTPVTASGTITAAMVIPFHLQEGCRVDLSAVAGSNLGGATATANATGSFLGSGIHTNDLAGIVSKTYSTSGVDEYNTYDSSGGAYVTCTPTGTIPRVGPNPAQVPRNGLGGAGGGTTGPLLEMSVRPKITVNIGGQFMRSKGPLSGAYSVDLKTDDPLDNETAILGPGSFSHAKSWQGGGVRFRYLDVSFGVVTLSSASQTQPWVMTGTITNFAANGYAVNPLQPNITFRCAPYRAFTIDCPSSTPMPINPAAGWNLGGFGDAAPESVTITDITGGLRFEYASATPVGSPPRRNKTYYRQPFDTTSAARPHYVIRTQALRYMRFQIRSVGAANQPVTMSITNRSWVTSTGADGEWVDVEIDFLNPLKPTTADEDQIETMQQDTSATQVYTIGAPFTGSVDTTSTGGAIGWGVDIVYWLQFVFGSGTAYEIRDFELVRKTEPLHFGFTEKTSRAQAAQAWRAGTIEIDGRRSFELITGKSGSGGYGRTLADVRRDSEELTGFSLIEVTPGTSDWAYVNTASYLGGGGFLYPPPVGQPSDYIGVQSPYVYAQAQATAVTVQPDMGDVFGSDPLGATSGQTPLYVMQSFGEAVNGVLYDNATAKPMGGGKVFLREDPPGTPTGTGISESGGALGRYLAGAPYVKANLNIEARNASGTRTVDFTIVPGSTVRRITLRVDPASGNAIHLARSLVDGAILETIASDGTVTTKTFNLGMAEIEGEVGDGETAQSYVHPNGTYHSFRSSGGSVIESRSYNQGETWTDV